MTAVNVPEPPEQKQTDKININTATAAELQTLPGIGEKRAGEIIKYRTQVGLFQSIDQIVNVKGIGDGIYSNIKELICVNE